MSPDGLSPPLEGGGEGGNNRPNTRASVLQ